MLNEVIHIMHTF